MNHLYGFAANVKVTLDAIGEPCRYASAYWGIIPNSVISTNNIHLPSKPHVHDLHMTHVLHN